MVLVENNLNSEQVSLMIPIHIENFLGTKISGLIISEGGLNFFTLVWLLSWDWLLPDYFFLISSGLYSRALLYHTKSDQGHHSMCNGITYYIQGLSLCSVSIQILGSHLLVHLSLSGPKVLTCFCIHILNPKIIENITANWQNNFCET